MSLPFSLFRSGLYEAQDRRRNQSPRVLILNQRSHDVEPRLLGQASQEQRGSQEVSREGAREGQGDDRQVVQAQGREREAGRKSQVALKGTGLLKEGLPRAHRLFILAS